MAVLKAANFGMIRSLYTSLDVSYDLHVLMVSLYIDAFSLVNANVGTPDGARTNLDEDDFKYLYTPLLISYDLHVLMFSLYIDACSLVNKTRTNMDEDDSRYLLYTSLHVSYDLHVLMVFLYIDACNLLNDDVRNPHVSCYIIFCTDGLVFLTLNSKYCLC